MVMLEPLISLIVCSCLGGEAMRPGPDPTDWHGLVRGKRRRREGGREGGRERERRGKERRSEETEAGRAEREKE